MGTKPNVSFKTALAGRDLTGSYRQVRFKTVNLFCVFNILFLVSYNERYPSSNYLIIVLSGSRMC